MATVEIDEVAARPLPTEGSCIDPPDRIRVHGKFFFAGSEKHFVKGVTYGPFAPGTHGAEVAGMHGMGVNTPIAAAVAAATAGFAGDMHMPNGMMFAIGT